MVDTLNFDALDEWVPSLSAVLSDHLPRDVQRSLSALAPETVQGAQCIVFEIGDRNVIVDKTLAWITSSTLIGYHGSRLTEADVASVQDVGLLPLQSNARQTRLRRALSPHPKWVSVADRLEDMLDAYGRGERAGRREGQVHLTLSRSELTNSFNHYLTHGSEFDQHVARDLLGEEGSELLTRDGNPTLLTFGVPGAVALKAAHPFFDIDDLRNRGDVPNIVKEFLEAWSYRLAYPDFRASSLHADCGLTFFIPVPSDWLISVEAMRANDVVDTF